MKHLSPLLALSLLACGAPEDAETLIITTGTAEQAATYAIHNESGRKASNSMRCMHNPNNFGGDVCGLPEHTAFRWSLNWATNVTSTERLGVSAGVRGLQGDMAAYPQWTFPRDADNSGTGVVRVHVSCFGLPAGTMGRADSGTFIGTGIKHYGQTRVMIDVCNLRARRNAGHDGTNPAYPAGTPWTNAQYSTFIYNVAKHEFAHAMGLGHTPSTSQCLLMSSPTNPECKLSTSLNLEPLELTILGTFARL